MKGKVAQDDSYDYDVLIVGGSMVGLAAAMFLAQQGVRVCLVERRDRSRRRTSRCGVHGTGPAPTRSADT